MRILFIHGFCSEISVPFLRIQTKAGSEFSLYTKDHKDAEVFRWAIAKKFLFGPMLNPFSYLRLYREELAKSRDPKTHAALHAQMAKMQPEVVFCHSMGCELLLHFLEGYDLPASVKKVIFVQADVHASLTRKVEEQLRERRIVIDNYFCTWDQALLSSVLFHKKKRGGSHGIFSPQVRNIFQPLFKLWNLHTATLRDKKFYMKALGEGAD